MIRWVLVQLRKEGSIQERQRLGDATNCNYKKSYLQKVRHQTSCKTRSKQHWLHSLLPRRDHLLAPRALGILEAGEENEQEDELEENGKTDDLGDFVAENVQEQKERDDEAGTV